MGHLEPQAPKDFSVMVTSRKGVSMRERSGSGFWWCRQDARSLSPKAQSPPAWDWGLAPNLHTSLALFEVDR